MSSIVVLRYLGDKKGQEVVDTLLFGTEAKLARGRAELDQNALPQQPVTMTIVYRPGLRLGQLVEVLDSTQGQVWRGKITKISHHITETNHTTDIEVQRPMEF